MKNLDVIYNEFRKSEGISIDTRQNCKKRIFFALKGENFNGNIYADEAIKKGASIVIIDENKTSYTDKGIHYEQSSDTNYYDMFNIKKLISYTKINTTI